MTANIPPFENRRLRYDRVVSKRSKQLDLQKIELFGDKKLGCLMYSSDHFGIKAEFIYNEKGLSITDNNFKQEFKQLKQNSHEYRSESTIKFYRIFSIVMIILILITGIFLAIYLPLRKKDNKID